MSETISAWTWPDIDTIDAVSATLRDRSKRLNIDIANIEENAQIYATSAEDLAKYRSIKIAEATHTVLIEQVGRNRLQLVSNQILSKFLNMQHHHCRHQPPIENSFYF